MVAWQWLWGLCAKRVRLRSALLGSGIHGTWKGHILRVPRECGSPLTGAKQYDSAHEAKVTYSDSYVNFGLNVLCYQRDKGKQYSAISSDSGLPLVGLQYDLVHLVFISRLRYLLSWTLLRSLPLNILRCFTTLGRCFSLICKNAYFVFLTKFVGFQTAWSSCKGYAYFRVMAWAETPGLRPKVGLKVWQAYPLFHLLFVQGTPPVRERAVLP